MMTRKTRTKTRGNTDKVTRNKGRKTGCSDTQSQRGWALPGGRFIAVAIALGLMLLPGAFSFAEKDKDKDKDPKKHYGLIFGTAYGPDDRPLYGARIEIHPADKKHPVWELFSDHRGEFAQRVPPGPTDYIISGEAEIALTENGVVQKKRKKFRAESKVHIEAEERQDIGLHFKE